jgi:hypothetical protein
LDDFTQLFSAWSGFFSALAQVSGGLVGLVFVALTFNHKALGVGSNPVLAALAQQTFADFLLLLLISLVMLVPQISVLNLGGLLAGFSIADILRTLRKLFGLRAHWRTPAAGWQIMQRFLLSVVAHVLIAWAGVALLLGGATPSLEASLMFSGIIMLLLSGCRSAWLLLVHTGE